MKLSKPEYLGGGRHIRPLVIESGFAAYAQCSTDPPQTWESPLGRSAPSGGSEYPGWRVKAERGPRVMPRLGVSGGVDRARGGRLRGGDRRVMPLARFSGPFGTWARQPFVPLGRHTFRRAVGRNGGFPSRGAGSFGAEVGGVIFEAVEQGVAADEARYEDVPGWLASLSRTSQLNAGVRRTRGGAISAS
jgi:hypothetical protein